MSNVNLGVDIQTGRPVALPDRDRLRGTYVVGVTGTGKTSLLRDLISQVIAAGQGAAVIDPHGDLIDQLTDALPAERIGRCGFIGPTGCWVSLWPQPLLVRGPDER